MISPEKRYCAFISYRHTSPDLEIASQLHRLIERYTIPSALRASRGARHPGRVFRDQEELPLSADLGKDIERALDESDYLICVCTPRYPESRWCMREIDYFLESHPRDHVLTLLAEGEPEDSFPPQLRYQTLPDGTRTEIEPLAADVRGATVAEHLKRLRREKLRILAPMLGTTYDGLVQRARRRRLKNGLMAALAALALAGGFLTYALIQNGRLDAERRTAAQNELDLLVEKSLSRTAENRKKEAQALALEARAVSETLEGYGQDRVRDALAVTCYAGDFAVEAVLNIPGVYAESYHFSPDGKKIAAVVSSAAVFCYDADTGAELWNATPDRMAITSLEWKADGSALALTTTTGHKVILLDGADGHVLASLDYDWASGACFSGDKVLCSGGPGIALWDPAGEADQIPLLCPSEMQGQTTSSQTAGGGQFLVRLDPANREIALIDIQHDRWLAFTPESAKALSAATPSPDGDLLYVRQWDLATVYDLVNDGIVWQREYTDAAFSGIAQSPARWTGDRIFDTGVLLDAKTGEPIAHIDETAADVSADGQYFLCPGGLYRTSDGSLYCTPPGQILAVDPTGASLLIQGAAPTRERMPGHGSVQTLAAYTGTLTDIPDWTQPADWVQLNDPVMWGASENMFAARTLISPDGRFVVEINTANHVKIYDLEKGNEPLYRLYGYPGNGFGNYIGDASFSADSRLLAVAGEMGQAAVYELESGKILQFWDDLYRVITLEDIRFNRDGTLVMVCGYQGKRFQIHSVENGLTLYDLYPDKPVQSWGFDEETGDGIIVYEDGTALCADIFTSADELYAYAEGL